jgi:hypothetical protein
MNDLIFDENIHFVNEDLGYIAKKYELNDENSYSTNEKDMENFSRKFISSINTEEFVTNIIFRPQWDTEYLHQSAHLILKFVRKPTDKIVNP